MPTARANGTPAAVWPQEQAPILCECRAYRRGRIGPHRDHRSEYARNRRLGLVFDDFAFAAIALETQLDPEELAR